MRCKSRARRAERGAETVEFALSLVLVLMLLYGTMEFGRFVYSYNVLASATREATRYAVVHGSKSGAPATAADVAAQVKHWAVGLDPSALTVTTTWTPGNSPGSTVQVQTQYRLTPVATLLLRSPITVGSRSQMMISQ
jgi:Flp pilus assembly protein TadG